MWVRPQSGLSYRHTRTKQLMPADGFEADPNDLDIARGLGGGDLVAAPQRAKAAKSKTPAADDPPST